MKRKKPYVFLLILLITCGNAYSQKSGETLSAAYTFDKEEELADWLSGRRRQSLH